MTRANASGIATPQQAERIVSEHFRDTRTFNHRSAFALSPLSRVGKMYNVRATGNPSSWLGPIWGVSREPIAEFGMRGALGS